MLTPKTARRIEREARRYLGKKYDRTSFNCLTFVRAVYAKVGLKPPPLRLNVSAAQLLDPPTGFVLYLKRRGSASRKPITHAVIILDKRTCIHCSYYFGGKVVISTLDEILKEYDVAKIT
jgi:hypothetical protein